ncbi:MAG: PAS domain S-box protein [Oscillatoriales cyanobacterium RU_3_3]|nr:PAS domain S-box protein [Oscillatoriales cyanobacterium RU_3_3]
MKDCHLLEGVLGSSEDRYRSVVEEQTELICRFLPDGTLTFVNKSFCCYFSQQSEPPIGQNFFQLILPAPGEADLQHLLSLHPEHPVVTCERRMQCTSGAVRWLQWTDKAIFDRADRLVEFQSVGRDITASKLLGQHDRDLLHLLGRAVKDSALYLLDVRGSIVSWNSDAQNIYGFPETEIVGQSFSCLFPSESIELGQPLDYLQQAQNQEFYEVESKRIRADGSEFWVNAALAPLHDNTGKICGFAEAVRDITERLDTAAALTEIQAKYQTLLQICPAGIIVTDASNNICETNPAAELILERSSIHQNLPNSNLVEWQMLSENGTLMANSEGAIAQAIASQQGVDNVEARIVKANGETVRARVTAAPIPSASGATAIAISDISEIEQHEAAIYQLEQKLETVLENIPDIVAIYDKELQQLPTNSKVKIVPEVADKTINLIAERWEIPPAKEAIWQQAIQSAFATGTQQLTELERSIAGEIKSYQARLVPQFDRDGSVASVLAIARNRDESQSQYTQPTFGQQKEFLQTIFDCLPVMVSVCDSGGELQLVNREWELVMGWSYLEAANIDLLAECYPDLARRQTVRETIADRTANGMISQQKSGMEALQTFLGRASNCQTALGSPSVKISSNANRQKQHCGPAKKDLALLSTKPPSDGNFPAQRTLFPHQSKILRYCGLRSRRTAG